MILNNNVIVNKQFQPYQHHSNNNNNNTENDLLSVEKFKLLKKIRYFIVLFSQSTTIHGIVYLARSGLHIIER